MTRLKYLLVAIALAGWFASLLLAYAPQFYDWASYVSAGCLLTMVFGALLALIRRKWHTLAIFCFPLVVIQLPQPSHWLRATGFRIHASPIEEYLSQCRLATFVEDGKKQQVGECQGIQTSEITWSKVIYDTTGQLILSRAQRTSEWKSAVGMLSSPDVYIETEGRASRIFGDFYQITVGLNELQGG